MIIRLTIQNVALIEKAEINFCAGLNVLSGETGAGKSVILDSINFVLGAKAEKSMIRHGEKECFVCAEFDIRGKEGVYRALQEMEIEADEGLIVSRRFTLEGRSSIRINGIPVNASMLKKITSQIVDVHGQSEHFFLLNEGNQLKVLDSVAGKDLWACKEELSGKIKQLKACKSRLNALGTDEATRSRRMDVLTFQIEEIKNADLKEGEEEELQAKRAKINSLEKIISALTQASAALDADGGATDAVRAAKRSVGSVVNLDETYQTLFERLENLQAEAEDIAQTLTGYGEELYFDENEMQSIENRLDEWKLLKKKYGSSLAEITDFLQKAEEEYDLLFNSEKEVTKLNAEIETCRKEIFNLCQNITALRQAAAKSFAEGVIAELKTLNIPSARFETQFSAYTAEDADKATGEGLDRISFAFSANAGEPVKSLAKIISGGEMSRFMLAIKTRLSKINEISTYIFDEIDAGISGKTAKVVAEKFAKIAQNTQIIAVSHLAQVVCMADREFLIKKSETNGKTKTEVRELSQKESIEELMRLLGADENSQFAEKHALELINTAKNYKKILLQNI